MRFVALALVLVGPAAALAQPVRMELGAAERIELRGPLRDPAQLSAYKDKALVLYFWSPDCEDCREKLAFIQRLAVALETSDPAVKVLTIAVVSASAADLPAVARKVERLTRDYGVPALLDLDGKLWTQLETLAIADSPPGKKARGGRVLPTTYLIGTRALRHAGTARVPMERFVNQRVQVLRMLRAGQVPPAEFDLDSDDPFLRVWGAPTPRR